MLFWNFWAVLFFSSAHDCSFIVHFCCCLGDFLILSCCLNVVHFVGTLAQFCSNLCTASLVHSAGQFQSLVLVFLVLLLLNYFLPILPLTLIKLHRFFLFWDWSFGVLFFSAFHVSSSFSSLLLIYTILKPPNQKIGSKKISL